MSPPIPAPAAVLDWDGTLRQGWTIEDWLESLLIHGHENGRALAAHFQRAVAKYSAGEISHDELVEAGEVVLLESLWDLTPRDLATIEQCTAALSVSKLWKFSVHLLEQLTALGLQCFVVTGASESVVVRSSRGMSIEAVAGLTLKETSAGWSVERNPGSSEGKQLEVDRIAETHRIVTAFGDSASDWPLWDAADVPVLVSKVVPNDLGRRCWLGERGQGYESVRAALVTALA